VGAHMDGHGWGEAANDDGSGTALVMELARVFSSPDVETERSIRFALWNNEETGLNGARAYIEQRGGAVRLRELPQGRVGLGLGRRAQRAERGRQRRAGQRRLQRGAAGGGAGHAKKGSVGAARKCTRRA